MFKPILIFVSQHSLLLVFDKFFIFIHTIPSASITKKNISDIFLELSILDSFLSFFELMEQIAAVDLWPEISVVLALVPAKKMAESVLRLGLLLSLNHGDFLLKPMP